MSSKAIYRRIRGRVVRIDRPGAAGADPIEGSKEVVKDADTLIMTKKPKATPDRKFQALGVALAAGGGALGAMALFAPSWKRAIGASVADIGLQSASSAANQRAWEGRSAAGEKRGKSINSLAWYGGLAATTALHRPTREIAVHQVTRGLEFLGKIIKRF